MNLITLDFETYYDSKIKLGFKHQTTEEYLRDSRFEVIGVGVQIEDAQPSWYAGDQDRKSTRLNSSHVSEFRMPSSA